MGMVSDVKKNLYVMFFYGLLRIDTPVFADLAKNLHSPALYQHWMQFRGLT